VSDAANVIAPRFPVACIAPGGQLLEDCAMPRFTRLTRRLTAGSLGVQIREFFPRSWILRDLGRYLDSFDRLTPVCAVHGKDGTITYGDRARGRSGHEAYASSGRASVPADESHAGVEPDALPTSVRSVSPSETKRSRSALGEHARLGRKASAIVRSGWP